MKTVKRTKKTVKPTFIVDLTNAVDGNDVLAEFAYAKVNADQKISKEELAAYTNKLFECVNIINIDCKIVNEKKRNFWQRIKYLFTNK